MPFVQVKTASGRIKFHYMISTPRSNDAMCIDSNLPTLLWFHSLGFPHVFHPQFNDPLLRKFNLVAFDMRVHGETEADDLPEGYGIKEAGEDAIAFMDALSLPACHFVAMDFGSPIALEVAVSHPDRVRSLFIISQTCLEEPADVREGHQQLFESWTASYPGPNEIDHDRMVESAYGYAQFMFNNNLTNLGQAMVNMAFEPAQRHWGYHGLHNYRIVTFEFLTSRKAQTREKLSRLRCPVKLVYGTDDIAYPQSYTEKFMQDLKDAGVNASLFIVPGAPHFVGVDHYSLVDPILHDFIIQCDDRNSPAASGTILSPWHEALLSSGWKPDGTDDDSDDDIVISYVSCPHVQMLH
ncbi:Alpha/Beta hydrolase protein [Lentinula aciculospora]|uniref:Alpha/Beta hydrolase protein n=1 Tax=Lentinula aciculospora TaxID=153920 RepID=A0A9W9A7X4_9AGAR|nr:Alpha/Beta hydrolase protein [Lentinula aciculospora]